MAWLVVSVCDPAAPVAVDVLSATTGGALPVIDSSAVSPAAALIQVFCRISGAEVRVLVMVQVTSAGVSGTA